MSLRWSAAPARVAGGVTASRPGSPSGRRDAPRPVRRRTPATLQRRAGPCPGSSSRSRSRPSPRCSRFPPARRTRRARRPPGSSAPVTVTGSGTARAPCPTGRAGASASRLAATPRARRSAPSRRRWRKLLARSRAQASPKPTCRRRTSRFGVRENEDGTKDRGLQRDQSVSDDTSRPRPRRHDHGRRVEGRRETDVNGPDLSPSSTAALREAGSQRSSTTPRRRRGRFAEKAGTTSARLDDHRAGRHTAAGTRRREGLRHGHDTGAGIRAPGESELQAASITVCHLRHLVESGTWPWRTRRSGALLGEWRIAIDPLRRDAPAAPSSRRRARRPLLPRLPQLALPLHRREGGAGGSHRARRGRRRRAVHPPPGRVRPGSTLERVALPDDLVARLEGKSSLGRLGLLIHSTAGFVDPGWDGHVTLELSNVANLPITIYPG